MNIDFKRKAISIGLLLVFISVIALPVCADEAEQPTVPVEPSVDTESGVPDLSAIFGFDIAQGNFAELDMSGFEEYSEQIDYSAFNQLKYDVPTNVEQAGMLNVAYAELLVSMQEAGFGEQYTLEIPEFEVGYSADIQKNFEDIFGNQLSSPPSMSMQDIMDSTGNFRGAQDLTQNGAYQSVFQHVNLGNSVLTVQSVVNGAFERLGIPVPDKSDILVDKDLSSDDWIANQSPDKNAPEASMGFDDITNMFQGNMDKYISVDGKVLANAYELSSNGIKDWIDEANGTNNTTITDAYNRTIFDTIREAISDAKNGQSD